MDFLFKYKKAFLVIGFIAVTILLGYLIFTLFFKSETPKTTIPTENINQGNLPSAGVGENKITENKPSTGLQTDTTSQANKQGTTDNIAKGGITKTEELNQNTSLAITSNSNGVQYYNKDDGKFYAIDQNGNLRTLSDKIFPEAQNVVWSPNKNKAIIEFPDGANVIYDFNTNKQVTLPAHWQDFDFSPAGDQIVMKSIGLDVNNRWLAITNEDGSKTQKIEDIGENADTVYPSWSPNNQSIAMYTEGVDFDRQEVYFVGLNDENFKSTVVEGRGFQSKWTPKGDKLLYSVYSTSNNLKPSLWVVNAQGETIGSDRKSLNIETWADKCAFSQGTTLYCAVPKQLDEGAGMFPEMAKETSDYLYKIDTQTGSKKMIAIPDGEYNISNIIVSPNEKTLYFTDEATKHLRKINL